MFSTSAGGGSGSVGGIGAGGGGGGGGGSGKSGSGGGGGLWAAYLALLDRRPLATKAVSAAVLNGLGDIIAQLGFEKGHDFDWRRLGVFTFLGFIFIGPALHYWYGTLGRLVTAKGTAGTLIKLTADQLAFAPTFISAILGLIMAFEGQAHALPDKLRQDLFTIVRSNWMLWVPFQFFNFRYVPVNLQVLSSNVVAPPLSIRRQARKHRVAVRVQAAAVEEEEDLWQYPDRDQWYLPKFVANDQPDWNPARFVRSTQLAPGIKEVVLEVEISREKVPLRNAYKHIGQRACVRINSGAEVEAAVASAPFPQHLNRDALYRARGDITANEIKSVKEELSIAAELALLVRDEGAQRDLYRMGPDDVPEAGPFKGGGLKLRGTISGIWQYPTIVIFCEGEGIATARALIEATPEVGGLNFGLRSDVRMYYKAPNEASFCYKGLFEEWESKHKVKVITSTRGTFLDMFDDDDTLMYEPATTAAIILTGGDEEAEEAAAEVCKEGEVALVVKQSDEQPLVEYLDKGKKE
ncbi:hypothetical protein N2152v2_001711 [Parachlorella kessleri]